MKVKLSLIDCTIHRKNTFKCFINYIFEVSQHVVLVAGLLSQSAASVAMFQAAAKTLSVTTATSVTRGLLLSIRHYCERTPAKLRVSEAFSGAELGAKIKVQVTLTPIFICGECQLICANSYSSVTCCLF